MHCGAENCGQHELKRPCAAHLAKASNPRHANFQHCCPKFLKASGKARRPCMDAADVGCALVLTDVPRTARAKPRAAARGARAAEVKAAKADVKAAKADVKAAKTAARVAGMSIAEMVKNVESALGLN